MKELMEYIESKIDKDFDFEVEHWENGNYDDSFEYGMEYGEQQTYRNILEKVKSLIED